MNHPPFHLKWALTSESKLCTIRIDVFKKYAYFKPGIKMTACSDRAISTCRNTVVQSMSCECLGLKWMTRESTLSGPKTHLAVRMKEQSLRFSVSTCKHSKFYSLFFTLLFMILPIINYILWEHSKVQLKLLLKNIKNSCFCLAVCWICRASLVVLWTSQHSMGDGVNKTVACIFPEHFRVPYLGWVDLEVQIINENSNINVDVWYLQVSVK